MAISKNIIARTIAKDLNRTAVSVIPVVNGVFFELIKHLRAGNTIEIRHLGTFEVKRRRMSLRKHPKTGKMVFVKEGLRVKFKQSKFLFESKVESETNP